VNYATLAQIVIAVGLVGYGVVVGVQQLRGRLGRRTRTPVDAWPCASSSPTSC